MSHKHIAPPPSVIENAETAHNGNTEINRGVRIQVQFVALSNHRPAAHHVIIASTLQDPCKQPAAMLSIKVCLDKSTYTDSSQQGYWSQWDSSPSPPQLFTDTSLLYCFSRSIYGFEMLRVSVLLLFKDNS